MFDMKRRVVVTGLGIISPLGNDVDTFWSKATNGENGIGPITHFETDERYASRIAGEVKDFDITNYMLAKEARRMDPFVHYGIAAAQQAVDDSKLDLEKIDLNRVGVIASSGIGGLQTLHQNFQTLFEKGPRRVSPFFIPMIISDILPGQISIRFGFKGPNFSAISACASSTHALGLAFRSIQYGDADIVISGGAEATVTEIGIAGFSSMKALSTRNDDPEHASRPFDAGRDGFVAAEGSGMLILEELEHALARNAKIYGEFVGFGNTGDAYHLTAPAPGGEGAARAMQAAITDAGLTPNVVDYINAHGTSTPHNDRTETQAIKSVFGDHAQNLLISSTKSMTGHLLGASGAVEAIATLKTFESGIVHPTRNQIEPDPECDLNYVPNKAVAVDVKTAISNSLGFGGHNACVMFKKYV
jgi:3-oxoacyl-[acyl-carrier-protein] synthase II